MQRDRGIDLDREALGCERCTSLKPALLLFVLPFLIDELLSVRLD